MSELSISERLRPHKERIARANAEWEALRQARVRKSVDLSKLKMRVWQRKNEISILIVDPSGDTAEQEKAVEYVMSLLRTLGVEVLESDSQALLRLRSMVEEHSADRLSEQG